MPKAAYFPKIARLAQRMRGWRLATKRTKRTRRTRRPLQPRNVAL